MESINGDRDKWKGIKLFQYNILGKRKKLLEYLCTENENMDAQIWRSGEWSIIYDYNIGYQPT